MDTTIIIIYIVLFNFPNTVYLVVFEIITTKLYYFNCNLNIIGHKISYFKPTDFLLTL